MILVFAFISGVIGALVIMRFGKFVGVLDVPNERSSHTNIIPKGGGIGILIAFVGGSVFLNIPKTFWMSATVLALVSFLGDRLDIKPKIRLLIQFACGMVFLIGLIHSQESPMALFFLIPPLLVFIVGAANFYNFMDGINGIAGITGAVGFLLLSAYGNGVGVDSRYITLSLVMVASCAGFLPFNCPYAKVFMGDVGSILLGFAFASISLMMAGNVLDFICMTSFLFPFYVDELTTMVVRVSEGDRLTQAHRKHVYQLLVNELGVVHWKVSAGYGVAQLFIGICVIIIKPYGFWVLLPALLLFFSICAYFFSHIRTQAGLVNQ